MRRRCGSPPSPSSGGIAGVCDLIKTDEEWFDERLVRNLVPTSECDSSQTGSGSVTRLPTQLLSTTITMCRWLLNVGRDCVCMCLPPHARRSMSWPAAQLPWT